MTLRRPDLIHVRKYARNGFYPDAGFYSSAVYAQNHLLAFRKKQVLKHVAALGSELLNEGTRRFRFHTGYATTRLVAYGILSSPHIDVLSTESPNVSISVTVPGGATTSFAPDMYGSGYGSGGDSDPPDTFTYHRSEVEVSPNQTYEGLVTMAENARLVSLCIFEESTGVVDESIDFFNELHPQAGTKIYDAHRQRLVQGLSQMWKRNGALQINWARENGGSRTRSSATPINLIDNTETGTPTANSAGWTLDGAYRTTSSRAVIPCVVAVYGSIASGSGTFRLIDTAGNTLGSITINSSTPQWWTTTANLVAAAGKFYAPQFAGDGANTLSLSACSVYEYEA